MNLIRFMGFFELFSYLSGETLENHTDWRESKKSSDSVGFCFFDDSQDPAYRCRYAAGVCDTSYVVWFTLNPFANVTLRRSKGRYRDPKRDIIRAGRKKSIMKVYMQEVDEYSLERYNISMLTLQKIGRPIQNSDGSWSILYLDPETTHRVLCDNLSRSGKS